MAIAVIVPLSLLLYSNSRIAEAKETLRAEMRSLHNEVLAELRELKTMLKIHELEHHRQ
jgi:hypothetical protein